MTEEQYQRISDVFAPIQVIRLRDKGLIATAEKEGKQYFIKATPTHNRDRLVAEVVANRFLTDHIDSSLIDFPLGELHDIEGLTYVVFPWEEAQAFADPVTFQIHELPSFDELQAFVDMLKQMDAIDAASIDEPYKSRIPHYGLDYYHDKMNAFAQQPLQREHMTHRELDQLLALMEPAFEQARFQHHDFILWNLMRREQGGGMLLTDSEYARIGLRAYDIAYYFLQTAIVLNDLQHAQSWVSLWKDELAQADFADAFFGSLAYRVTANMNEVLNDDMRERAQRVLGHVLTKNLSFFVT